MFAALVAHEQSFERTMKRTELADRDTPFVMAAADVAAATSENCQEAIVLPTGTWRLPAGAYDGGKGPN